MYTYNTYTRISKYLFRINIIQLHIKRLNVYIVYSHIVISEHNSLLTSAFLSYFYQFNH